MFGRRVRTSVWDHLLNAVVMAAALGLMIFAMVMLSSCTPACPRYADGTPLGQISTPVKPAGVSGYYWCER